MSFKEELKDSSEELRNKVLPALERLGVAKVEVTYSGYGDDGDINDVTFYDAEGQAMSLDPPACGVDFDPIYELVPEGFEYDLGSEGTVTIDVTSGTVTLEHGDRVTRWSTTRWEV